MWMPNPRFLADVPAGGLEGRRPGYPRRRLNYLVKEVFGVYDLDDLYVYVTDGGHWENLGLVELLRRRCSEVFCFDASGSLPDSFGTLAEAITLAAQELGATVEVGYEPLRALSSGGRLERYVARDCAVGLITYTDGSRGILWYAKISLTADAPSRLRAYKEKMDIFPCHPTSDQFFDTEQFETYRELGVFSTDHLLSLRSQALEVLAGTRTRGTGRSRARRPPRRRGRAAVRPRPRRPPPDPRRRDRRAPGDAAAHATGPAPRPDCHPGPHSRGHAGARDLIAEATTMDPAGPSEITDEEVARFWRDGAICLRGAFAGWVDTLRDHIEEALDQPGPLAAELGEPGLRPAGRRAADSYFVEQGVWNHHAGFERFARRSPSLAIAHRLLGSTKVNLFFDQLFVKEPGSPEQRTPWHQDLPYWPIRGRQVLSVWVTVDHRHEYLLRPVALDGRARAGLIEPPFDQVDPLHDALSRQVPLGEGATGAEVARSPALRFAAGRESCERVEADEPAATQSRLVERSNRRAHRRSDVDTELDVIPVRVPFRSPSDIEPRRRARALRAGRSGTSRTPRPAPHRPSRW